MSVPIAAVLLGCGPTTTVGQSDDGTGDAADADDDDDDDDDDVTSGPGPDTTADGGSDDSSGTSDVCGDGMRTGDEACDDGNTDNADGCSAQCQLSGTLLWSVPFDASPQGFAVGLDARDGNAYPAIQIFEDNFDPSILLGHVDRDGTLFGETLDVGGFSDIAVARQLVAAVPGGDVIAGYTVVADQPPLRVVSRMQVGGSQAWDFSAEDWQNHYATLVLADWVYVLHGKGSDLVVDGFTLEGEHTGELSLGLDPLEHRPFLRGAMLLRAVPSLGVFTVDLEGGIDFHYVLSPQFDGTWYTDPIGTAPAGSMPRAFFDGQSTRIWTDTELITMDSLDHIESVVPRPVPGEVLLSFITGYATVDDAELRVFGPQGGLRWNHTSDGLPQYARADGDAGLFVLSDQGVDGSTATLSYLVL